MSNTTAVELTDQLNVSAVIVLGIILSSAVLITICGNSLVVFAVLREHHMRANLTNRFLVSLALADLLMGSFVMPIAVMHTIRNGDWPFGRDLCDIWHATDVLSSTASILSLCSIAIERFWATENPIQYASRHIRRRCSVMIAMVWIASLVISFPAIAWWRLVDKKRENLNATGSLSEIDSNTCKFTSDRTYLITSSFVSFYIPLIVMVVVYARIYRTASNLIKGLRMGHKVVEYPNKRKSFRKIRSLGHRSLNGTKSPVHDRIESDVERITLRVHRGGSRSASYLHRVPVHRQGEAADRTGKYNGKNNTCLPAWLMKTCVCRNDLHVSRECSNIASLGPRKFPLTDVAATTIGMEYENWDQTVVRSSVARLDLNNPIDSNQSKAKHWVHKLSLFSTKSRISKFVRDQKAAKTLGIVMGLFIGCWLPFFICNIVVALWPHLPDVSRSFQITLSTVTWLGYFNSGINPIIYAHSMREYRRAFGKIMCPWLKQSGVHRSRVVYGPGKRTLVQLDTTHPCPLPSNEAKIIEQVTGSRERVASTGEQCSGKGKFCQINSVPVQNRCTLHEKLLKGPNSPHRGLWSEFSASLPSQLVFWESPDASSDYRMRDSMVSDKNGQIFSQSSSE